MCLIPSNFKPSWNRITLYLHVWQKAYSQWNVIQSYIIQVKYRLSYIVGPVFSLNVSLNGPDYIKAGDEIWVNCSTNMTPYGKIAEFLVNGVTFKTLQKKSTGCFSAISNIKCVMDTCMCSADGKVYSLKIKETLPNRILNISCSMKFRLHQTIFASDNIRISVLGICFWICSTSLYY